MVRASLFIRCVLLDSFAAVVSLFFRSFLAQRRLAHAGGILFFALIGGENGIAATQSSIWLGGSGNWSDGTQWTTDPLYPNNGNGGFNFDASVDSGTSTLTESIVIRGLTLTGSTTLITGDYDLTSTGSTTWTGGALATSTHQAAFNPVGGLSLSGSNEKVLLDRTIGGGGTVDWSGAGQIALGGGAIFNNSGLFNVNTDSAILTSSGTPVFNNTGTFRKSLTSGVTEVQVPFNNSGGTVDVQSGKIYFEADGTIAGTYNTAAGQHVDFRAGTWSLDPSAQFTGDGATLSGATLNLSGSVNLTKLGLQGGTIAGSFTPTGPFNLNGATLTGTLVDGGSPINWTGGVISGAGTQVINAGTTFTVDSVAGLGILQNTRTISSAGITSLGPTVTTDHYMYNGAIFNNSGTYTIRNNGSQILDLGAAPPPAFNNSGTLQNSAEAGSASIGVKVNNSGDIISRGGTFNFFGGYTQSAGNTTLNGGDIGISAGSLQLLGGSLKGSGSINGNVISTATISPGLIASSAGNLVISGTLSLAGASHLTLELGGTIAGTTYDHLAAGMILAGGNIEVKFINGFQNSVNNAMTFTLLNSTGSGIVDSFDNVADGNRLATSDGLGSFMVNYGGGSHSSDLTISDFQPVPEPKTYALVTGMALLGVGALRRRKQAR